MIAENMYRLPILLLLLSCTGWSLGQAPSKQASSSSAEFEKSATLAESGHCPEAIPSLKKAVRQVTEKTLKRRIGLDGVRCAMTLNQPSTALEFLQVLSRDFPRDPDFLYAATHAYSDLSGQASQELARSAPSSYQAHELLAESFESQGKWDAAEKEYRGILKENPNVPGIHFRLGRLLLSRPNSEASVGDAAKQEFEQELKIDPSNAGAEYVLGELARQGQQWDEAVAHFSRATKLDARFGEAFLGLGLSLIAKKQYADAVGPLETAIKLEPRNPDAHYNLAMAYARTGRRQEGENEFAIHKRLIENQGGPDGGPPAAQPAQNN
jgi:Tfp pilus assembly protein PilF